MIYLYLFGTCFHFIYVFMIIGKYCFSNKAEAPNKLASFKYEVIIFTLSNSIL